jgi:mono/diheme cytochrome c family protein
MFLRMDQARHMMTMGPGMMGPGMMGRGMMGRGRGGMMGPGGSELPTVDQRDTILKYLQAHALRTMPEQQLPPGPGAALFRRACSRCHALPNPEQHGSPDWPAVVQRMREHMRQMNLPDLTESETREIDEYLANTADAMRRPQPAHQ